MLPDNSWYGHRRIFLEYLGLRDQKIFGALQHGWRSQISDVTPNKKKYFYRILVWTKNQRNFYLKKKNYNVFSIGAPFLYLCKILETKKSVTKIKDETKNRVLVFPAHSSQGFGHKTDHKLLIKKIKKEFKGQYTVCFYYYDLNKEDINLYKKNNWNIVCCVKNKTDQLSLFKIYNEINNHDVIISTEFSSSLFYGMFLKKKTKVLLSPNKRINSYTKDEKKFLKFYTKKYPELFKKVLSPKKGFELAKKELGYESFKSKNELLKILGVNSFLNFFLANIFAFFYDLKYSSSLRKGNKLADKNLKKYISVARNNNSL